MGIPVNKVVLIPLLGYVFYEIYTVFEFCQAPVVDESSADAVRWDLNEVSALDVRLFLSTSERRPKLPVKSSTDDLFLCVFEGIDPSDEKVEVDAKELSLHLPRHFYDNVTIYLHGVATRSGTRDSVVRHEIVKISRFVLQPSRKLPTRSLLTESVEDLPVPGQPVSSLPAVVEVGFVQEPRPLNRTLLIQKGLMTGKDLRLPLHVNTLISPRDEYQPLEGEGNISLTFRYRNVGLAYWTMAREISKVFDQAETTMSMNEYDVDSFKQMIGGSTPLKVILVYSIAILHLVFEYLAFASDITFWRAKTSFEGLSSSTVAMQAGINIIMFFYVQEQRQTKFILYMLAMRFCLHLWKLRKLTTFRRCSGFPFVSWVNRSGVESGLEELQEIDQDEQRCMRWLMIVLFPLIVTFSIYRLATQKYRSWYSWFVLTLAICAQMGGFVVMTPQVFMNYRLKSVEHLPWKALTYQAINTFIDDIFMMCIRMPEVQKYSVFRDDIIFVICCYQRWLYRKPKQVAPGDAPVEGEKAKED